jgi:hypothetical protein
MKCSRNTGRQNQKDEKAYTRDVETVIASFLLILAEGNFREKRILQEDIRT